MTLLTVSIPSEGRELLELHTSVRALGMGNAYTAIVNDGDSMFYNPAGLAQGGIFSWTLIDPRIAINNLDSYQDFQEIAESEDLATTLNRLYGRRIHVSGGGKSAVTIGSLGFVAYGDGLAGLYLSNPAYPQLHLDYIADYGFGLGAGFSLIPGFVKFGMVAKRISRVGTRMTLGPSTLATLESDAIEAELKNRGNGYGLDVGMVVTLPGPVSPTLSFVMKDLGTTTFSHEGGASAPPSNQSEMIVGAALMIDLPLISIYPALDYKHINDSEEPIGKKLHLGVEIDLPLIDLRAGLNQGYYTLGAGVNLGFLDVDVATYGVELGEYPGQHEDRRYVAQVTLELGFDSGFFSALTGGGSGSGSGGKGGSGGRRRLKQRR